MEPRTALPHSPSSNPAVATTQGTSSSAAARTNPLLYILAVAFGLFSGWVNQQVNDALLTALCVLFFTMLLGVWKKERPWRWLVLVWIGVPLMLGYYQFVVHWPHNRGQIYGAFVQVLAASAGANGGHYMRDMIDHVFLKQDD